MQTTLPIYRNALDWDAFFAEFPVPDVFAATVFTWSPERIRALQEERFARLLEHAWQNPFYQRRWSAAGLEPGDVRTLDEIGQLPFFTSDDIKDDQVAHPPFGTIGGVGLADLAHLPLKIQTSGGTTGTPRATLYAPRDWEMNALSTARGLWMQGARPGDVMQIPATNSLANIGWAYYKACHDYLGMLPITTGSGVVTPTIRQLDIAFRWGTNCWISFPEYLTQLAKVCRDELGRDPRELNTKFLSTFLGPDIDGTLRRQLAETFGCPVLDNYGTHEIGLGAFDCWAQAGMHLMEDCAYFEFLDVDTNEPVPFGESGNLVVTMFSRRVPPIVRLNLRDLGKLVATEPCVCGGTFRRIGPFLGRSDDMVKLRGVNVYPMACLPAIKSDPRTTGEWICVVDRHVRDGVIRDEMTVRVALRPDAGGTDGLREHLERRLQADLSVKVAVELVGEHDLDEVANLGREGKARRLLDRRFVTS